MIDPVFYVSGNPGAFEGDDKGWANHVQNDVGRSCRPTEEDLFDRGRAAAGVRPNRVFQEFSESLNALELVILGTGEVAPHDALALRGHILDPVAQTCLAALHLLLLKHNVRNAIEWQLAPLRLP